MLSRSGLGDSLASNHHDTMCCRTRCREPREVKGFVLPRKVKGRSKELASMLHELILEVSKSKFAARVFQVDSEGGA